MTRRSHDIILGLDTAASACSVAVWRSGEVVADRHRVMARGHAEALIPMVDEALSAAGVDFDDLSGIGVTVGPGSFTGVRAGLAAARGFALAREIPLIGVDTFEAIAHAVPEEVRTGRGIAVAVDTKRRDLYFQAFGEAGSALAAGCVASPEQVVERLPPGPLVVVGDGRRMLLPLLRARGGECIEYGVDAPHARDVAYIAAHRASRAESGLPPVPLYLREPEAIVPRFGGRLRP